MNTEKKDVRLVTPGEVFVAQVDKISVYSVRDHTFFIGLKDILPEDIMWRKEHPRVPSLVCFEEDHACDCPWGCVAKAAARCMWFFARFKKLKQILILFKREERMLLRQQYMRVDHLGNIREDQAGVPTEKVPRIWALIVPHNFYDASIPYRMSRVNHNGLQLVLKHSDMLQIDVDTNFWAGMV